MSEVEIEYIVPNISDAENQHDFQKILAAIGEHQLSTPYYVDQTAELSQDAENTVSLRVLRGTRHPIAVPDALELAMQLQSGVESKFPEQDRTRLQARFAGIATRDTIEVMD